MDSDKNQIYKEWNKLVNMTSSQLQAFLNSDEGKEAGLTRSEAGKLNIRNGRDSARAILRMKSKNIKDWNSTDWDWAVHQIKFIKRMSGIKGPLYDKNGRKTRLLLSLLVWGHNPEKNLNECFSQANYILEKCSEKFY